jgi:hypothetical protein
VIQVLKAKFPPGLKAVSRPDGHGGLVIYVAEGLNPDASRAAVRKVQCAARRGGWLRALLPVPVAAAVAQAVAHPRGTLTMLGAVAATGSLAGAAAILPPTSPAQHLSPAGRVTVSAPAPQHRRRRGDGTYLVYPQPAPRPVPQQAPAVLPHSGASPSPSVSPSPVSSVTGLLPPQESPSPAPVVCATVLFVQTCVKAAA